MDEHNELKKISGRPEHKSRSQLKSNLLTCHTDISECSTINLLLHKLNEELTVLGCATFACVRFECEKAILYINTLSFLSSHSLLQEFDLISLNV